MNTRRNSISSRASLGGMVKGRDSMGVPGNRRSSVGGRKSLSNENPAMRSAQDPEFKNAAMKTLLQYLTSHGYSHPLTPKSIQKPSVKDFSNIVIFLFRQVDRHISMKGKFEDDVVSIFKQLKYQHNISKQNLAAPGTPHTWPTLLATLHWLVDLLIYCDNSSVEINAVQEYLFKSYEYFNKGEDDMCEQLYEDFVSKVRVENEDILQEVSNIEREMRDNQRELDDIERTLQHYPELQDKLSDYKSDYAKFQQLIAELTTHQSALEQKGKQRERDIEDIDQQIAAAMKEVETLQYRVDSQSISAKEAELIRSQQAQLQKEQEATAAKYKEIQEKIYTAEDTLRNNVAQLEKTAHAYAEVAEGLTTLSSSSKKQIAINIDVRAKKKTGLVLTDIHNHILPTILTMRNDAEIKNNQYTAQILDLDDHLEKFLSKIEEMETQEQSLSEQLTSLEDNYTKDKALFEQIASERSADIRSMEAQLVETKDLSCEELATSAANRRLVELRAMRESESLRHSVTKKELINDILNAVTDCAHFRDYIQTQLREVKALHEERLDYLAVKANE